MQRSQSPVRPARSRRCSRASWSGSPFSASVWLGAAAAAAEGHVTCPSRCSSTRLTSRLMSTRLTPTQSLTRRRRRSRPHVSGQAVPSRVQFRPSWRKGEMPPRHRRCPLGLPPPPRASLPAAAQWAADGHRVAWVAEEARRGDLAGRDGRARRRAAPTPPT